MQWIVDTFWPYCKRQGYDLFKDDIKFIETKLELLPKDNRRPILFEYCKVWQRAMDKEREVNRKQSAGRVAANQFLLNYTGKVNA